MGKGGRVIGPLVFLLVFMGLAVTGAGVAVVLRVRGQRARWAGWQHLAAARGLQAAEGDPLGVGPVLSGSGRQRSVQRTLSGTVDGIPVAVVVTVSLTSVRWEVRARSDVVGLASVGAPVPVERIRSALRDVPGVRIGAAGELAVVEPQRGLRLAVDAAAGGGGLAPRSRRPGRTGRSRVDGGILAAVHRRWQVEPVTGLRPLERRVLRLAADGVDDAEIGRRFRHSADWAGRVRALALVPRGGGPVAPVGGLRPLERRILRWRDSGADYAELAPRFRRSPEFLQRVEVMAGYRLDPQG